LLHFIGEAAFTSWVFSVLSTHIYNLYFILSDVSHMPSVEAKEKIEDGAYLRASYFLLSGFGILNLKVVATYGRGPGISLFTFLHDCTSILYFSF